MVFAIIDTNVIVSSFISKNHSPPVMVVEEMLGGRITPLFNPYLLSEYREVLSRDRFGIKKEDVDVMINAIECYGRCVETFDSGTVLPDMKDVPIFEVALSTRDDGSFLVTGNIKHFPNVDYVVTPKQMMDILNSE